MSNPSSDSYRNPLRYQGQDYSFAPRYYRPRDPLPPQNASTDIKPKENQGYYPLASFWSNSTNGNLWVLTEIVDNLANWVLVGTAKGSLLSLSDNLNPPGSTVVFPSSSGANPPDDIQLTGQVNNQTGFFSTTVGNPSNHSIAINPMSVARWIVDPLGINGTHTTINGAITASSPDDSIFIMPGVYTENLTISKTLNFFSSFDNAAGSTVIFGLVTISGNIVVTFNGIRFNDNGVAIINPIGSSQQTISFFDCTFIELSANPILVNSNSSAQTNILFESCMFTCQVAGSQLFASAAPGTLFFNYCTTSTISQSVTPSILSAGTLFINYCDIDIPITTSGTSGVSINYSSLVTFTGGVTPLIIGGSGSNEILYNFINGGTVAALSIGGAAEVNLQNNTIFSSATNAITGAGSINYANNSFVSSSLISTTTQTPNVERFGTHLSTLHPCFSATQLVTATNVTGDGTNYTIGTTQPLSIIFDQNGNLNTNGTFTAPYAGKYMFIANIRALGLTVSDTFAELLFVTSLRTYFVSLSTPAFATSVIGGAYTFNCSTIADMRAGDTCVVQLIVSGSTATVSVKGDNTMSTFFQGYLLC